MLRHAVFAELCPPFRLRAAHARGPPFIPPHQEIGDSASQAFSKMFGCGVGEPTSHSDAGSVMSDVSSRLRLGVGVKS